MESSIKKTIKFPHPKNKVHTEEFNVPELEGRAGLFIIELTGNGNMSRAIVKKGSLTLIHKDTLAGHIAFVIDEDQ